MKQINILPSEGLQSPPLSTVSMMFSYDSKPNEDKRDKKKIQVMMVWRDQRGA